MEADEIPDDMLLEELRRALGGAVTGPEVALAVDIPRTMPPRQCEETPGGPAAARSGEPAAGMPGEESASGG
jgi:hypothetical protein